MIQLPVQSETGARNVLIAMEPILTNTTMLEVLVQDAPAGAGASWDSGNGATTFVGQSPYISGDDDDEDEFPAWIIAVIAAVVVAIASGCVVYACGCCGRKRDGAKEVPANDNKKPHGPAELRAAHPAGAEQV